MEVKKSENLGFENSKLTVAPKEINSAPKNEDFIPDLAISNDLSFLPIDAPKLSILRDHLQLPAYSIKGKTPLHMASPIVTESHIDFLLPAVPLFV